MSAADGISPLVLAGCSVGSLEGTCCFLLLGFFGHVAWCGGRFWMGDIGCIWAFEERW